MAIRIDLQSNVFIPALYEQAHAIRSKIKENSHMRINELFEKRPKINIVLFVKNIHKLSKLYPSQQRTIQKITTAWFDFEIFYSLNFPARACSDEIRIIEKGLKALLEELGRAYEDLLHFVTTDDLKGLNICFSINNGFLPSSAIGQALQQGAANEAILTVQTLVNKHSDKISIDDKNWALKWACKRNHPAIVKLLSKCKDIDPAVIAEVYQEAQQDGNVVLVNAIRNNFQSFMSF